MEMQMEKKAKTRIRFIYVSRLTSRIIGAFMRPVHALVLRA